LFWFLVWNLISSSVVCLFEWLLFWLWVVGLMVDNWNLWWWIIVIMNERWIFFYWCALVSTSMVFYFSLTSLISNPFFWFWCFQFIDFIKEV
jgi:hypothetical protein